MTNQTTAKTIRAKKLGLLMYDARIAARRSPAECAGALEMTEEAYLAYESGMASPSLPEMEALAFFLNVPVDHFWGRELLSTKAAGRTVEGREQLMAIRQRMVGATLRKLRMDANLTTAEVAEQTGLNEEDVRQAELGEWAIPMPELEALVTALSGRLDLFLDQRGPVGRWRRQQEAVQDFLKLPGEMQDFVSRPVNQPYLELARRLSDLSVEKLRTIAESLLEITY